MDIHCQARNKLSEEKADALKLQAKVGMMN